MQSSQRARAVDYIGLPFSCTLFPLGFHHHSVFCVQSLATEGIQPQASKQAVPNNVLWTEVAPWLQYLCKFIVRYGGGCAVHYPSVELSEIRRIEHGGKRHSERAERHSVRRQGSLSRDRVIRYDSRTRKGNKGNKDDRSWKDAGRDRHAWW